MAVAIVLQCSSHRTLLLLLPLMLHASPCF
ncbi:hypothetical protein GMORB2_0832 [Geosmithia morbida]|uniref:Uncharacterized protein n=1 Tax=Geosmithia morbida TaxID=1094350 RepID=A0A9P4YYT6_9HYPO|nr:uncharacterized protein GMORB2_0832 [Geosmithia morbida]KAF4125588.1 hypothetical protein GMORB2_0832 [Geosmithia morbida]